MSKRQRQWVIEEVATARNFMYEEGFVAPWPEMKDYDWREKIADMSPRTLEECVALVNSEAMANHAWFVRIRNIRTGEVIPIDLLR